MDTAPVRRLSLAFGVAAVVLVLDQVTKFWAERTLSGRAPISVFGEFVQLRLLYNPGAAVTVVWLLRYVVVFALLLGGATTHLIDRLFRAPGSRGGMSSTSSTTTGGLSGTSRTSRWSAARCCWWC